MSPTSSAEYKLSLLGLLYVLTIASLRHTPMGRNGDYFLNYKDYSKKFDVILKLLLVI